MASRKLTLVATQLLAAALAVVPAPRVHAGSTYKVLHNFGSGQDGSLPYGPPLLDNKGNVYGVTFNGGTGKCSDYGCGAVFELIRSRNGWSEKLLHSFTSAEGSPWGPLIYDQAGNVYGTSVGGPTSDSGAFELSPDSKGWNYIVLYNNGAGPGLVFDLHGNLYGAIGPGNYYGIGAIGELSPGSQGWTYTDLGNFNPTVGYAPPAPPVWDAKGNLYGTTHYGGIGQPKCTTSFGCGVIFKVAKP